MSADLDALVAQARSALVRGGAASPPVQADTGPFRGTAADGLVRAEVSAAGRVTSLHLDPAVFARPLDDVAAAARVAVNAALERRPGRVDLAPVIDIVRAAQVQARRQLDEITRGIADVTAHVRAAGPSAAAEEEN